MSENSTALSREPIPSRSSIGLRLPARMAAVRPLEEVSPSAVCRAEHNGEPIASTPDRAASVRRGGFPWLWGQDQM